MSKVTLTKLVVVAKDFESAEHYMNKFGVPRSNWIYANLVTLLGVSNISVLFCEDWFLHPDIKEMAKYINAAKYTDLTNEEVIQKFSEKGV